ncbi:MAG: hypothetical protein HWN67_05985 [Candidatus Helarchaeota archaeon]|nr:hypothetical protein [Candidatus Helarchaeota archaeon]
MSNDQEIKYDGVLYHLPLYEDEIVNNIIKADKHIERRKDIDGYIILTNYRFIFMRKIEDLEYNLSNFFYYKDIESIKIGGIVNKFIRINGVLFHPKDVSVDYLKNSIKKFTLEAESQSFSFEPMPKEEPIPEVKIDKKNIFNKVINFLFPCSSIVIGVILVLTCAFWFHFGPHSRLPFVASILGVVLTSVLMGLVKHERNKDFFSEELFESLKETLYIAIAGLSISSIGLGIDGYYGLNLTLTSARNNFFLLFSIIYFAIGVLLMFKIGTNYTNFPLEPDNPYFEFNNAFLENFETDRFQKLSKYLLIIFGFLIAVQMLILTLYNILPGRSIYLVFSLRFSSTPSPYDFIFVFSGINYDIFSQAFIISLIIVGVVGLVVSALLQVRNIGYLQYYILDIMKTIKKYGKEQKQRVNLLKERIVNKTKRILQQMHAFVSPINGKIIPVSQIETKPPTQERIVGVGTNTINSNSIVKEIPFPDTSVAKPITVSKEEEIPIPETVKETPTDAIIGSIEVKRGGIIKGSEYLYKVKVENLSNSVITDLRIIITSYPDDSLKIAGSEMQKRAKLVPGEMVSPSFTFRPSQDCIVGKINSIVTYLDARGESKQISVDPLMIRFICGLLTPLPIKAEEFDKIVKKLLNYSNAGEEIELPHSAKSIYEKARLLLPQNNFYLISAEDHEVASNFIGILKGFAAGQYSHKKVGAQITITGRKDDNFCAARIDGYTEDSSMLSPLISELKNEIKSWNCEQCGAQLSDSQIKKIIDSKIVRCKYCDEILKL